MGTESLNEITYRDSLDEIVVAICRDYFPRAQAIQSGRFKRRTIMEYRYINSRLDDAAREIVGDEYLIYLREIGESVGYAKSEIPDISESKYKRLKREVKMNVARKLHLLD